MAPALLDLRAPGVRSRLLLPDAIGFSNGLRLDRLDAVGRQYHRLKFVPPRLGQTLGGSAET